MAFLLGLINHRVIEMGSPVIDINSNVGFPFTQRARLKKTNKYSGQVYFNCSQRTVLFITLSSIKALYMEDGCRLYCLLTNFKYLSNLQWAPKYVETTVNKECPFTPNTFDTDMIESSVYFVQKILACKYVNLKQRKKPSPCFCLSIHIYFTPEKHSVFSSEACHFMLQICLKNKIGSLPVKLTKQCRDKKTHIASFTVFV
jgi:hypothetical protein